MRPYWVTFERLEDFNTLSLGAGVTAHDPDDVNSLVASAFGQLEIRSIAVVEDVATLDQGQVRPNMGNIFIRGIWFPLGHELVGSPTHR